MLDIKFIRENIDLVKKAIETKKVKLDLDQLLTVDDNRKKLVGQMDEIRRQRNEAAAARDIENGKRLKQELDVVETQFSEVDKEYKQLMVQVPNIVSSDTPIGKSDEENVEVERWGEIPKFDFEIKDHVALAKSLDIIDFERGTKVGGYRGYFLKNEGAILVMALMNYAFKKLSVNGFTPMIPPTLVKDFVLYGSGYFKAGDYDPEVDEIYQVATSDKEANGETSKDRKFLVGTAEPSLLGYYAGEVLQEDKLPIKLVGYSQCYRSEIGSYGKDTKGLYRVHEFMKVEQVILAPADMELAEKLQQEMVELSAEMHKELGLTFRKLQICTGDMGLGKYKMFDLEAWLPGLNRWGETGSASNFLDWQARRLDVKYQTKEGERKPVFMLNNTALPAPRILIAILENFQQADGSVKIPDVLIPYTGFSEIRPK